MMAVENVSSCINKEEEDDAPLPGFRFHPTDEELVGFYLRRKVDKKPIRLDLIKLLDIYKYDPWDLPKCKSSSSGGEKEWYFFCRRGRKYKNSVRPNRVTGSGFWKATGIDKPIYSDRRQCIGLKKSLVYYRGAAGKGTKTDWMMHEFRLPDKHTNPIPQEAEVWTLCRVLKRNLSNKKVLPEWREMKASNNNDNPVIDARSETCSVDSNGQSSSSSNYISFIAPVMEKKPAAGSEYELLSSSQAPTSYPIPRSYMYGDINELLRHVDWEDLRSLVENTPANSVYY